MMMTMMVVMVVLVMVVMVLTPSRCCSSHLHHVQQMYNLGHILFVIKRGTKAKRGKQSSSSCSCFLSS